MSDIIGSLTALIQERALTLVRLAADQVVTQTQDAAPVAVGDLKTNIYHDEPSLQDPYITCTVHSDADYSGYVDRGTGVYGPSGAPIQGNPLLVFRWPKVGPALFFFRSVKGTPATNFFTLPMGQRWSDALFDNAGAFAG